MSSFTRISATSCLAGTFMAVTLLVSGASAATIGKSQAVGPCGPVVPPQARCGSSAIAQCVERRLVAKYKNDRKYYHTCCTKWRCVIVPR
jgi:hypothetical protein